MIFFSWEERKLGAKRGRRQTCKQVIDVGLKQGQPWGPCHCLHMFLRRFLRYIGQVGGRGTSGTSRNWVHQMSSAILRMHYGDDGHTPSSGFSSPGPIKVFIRVWWVSCSVGSTHVTLMFLIVRDKRSLLLSRIFQFWDVSGLADLPIVWGVRILKATTYDIIISVSSDLYILHWYIRGRWWRILPGIFLSILLW